MNTLAVNSIFRDHRARASPTDTATTAIPAPSFYLRAPNRMSYARSRAKFCFRLRPGPLGRGRWSDDRAENSNAFPGWRSKFTETWMRRSRSDPREDLEKVIRGLKFVSLVLFSLPVCVGLLILAAAVMTSGHRPGVPIFPLNSQWASLLSGAFRISITPGFAVLVYLVVNRLRYRPLEHRLAFVAFSLVSLVIFVFAPSRSHSRDGVNPAVTLALEKQNVGVYQVPGGSNTIGVKNIPVAVPLSRQADKDPSFLQNAETKL